MQLRCRAISVGSIKVLGPTCDVDNDFFPLAEWESLVLDPLHVKAPETPKDDEFDRQDYFNGPAPLPKFYRTLIMDELVYPKAVTKGFNTIRRHNGEPGLEDRDIFKSDFEAPSLGTNEKQKVPLQIILNPSDYCSYKSLASPILAPEASEVGDSVRVLRGANVPYVFQDWDHVSEGPCSDEKIASDVAGYGTGETKAPKNPMLRLIGACYVQSIMQGELWMNEETMDTICGGLEPVQGIDRKFGDIVIR